MKKKALLSSILTIALCLSLIAGSTFALFTSTDTVNVAVTSGKVNVVAAIENINLGSSLGANLSETQYSITNGNELALSGMVPGDYIEFDLKVTNNSDVTIKYRTILKVAQDNGLWKGLEVTIGDDGTYDGQTKVSKWTNLTPTDTIDTVHVKISLPNTGNPEIDNQYQEKTCTITYTVEAVQGNAKPASEWDGETSTPATKSEDGYYHITNAAEFIDFINNYMTYPVADEREYVLDCDIDLGGYTIKTTTEQGNRSLDGQTFDGQNHTVSNFIIDSTANPTGYYGGLFGYMAGYNASTIKNLTVKDAVVIGGKQTGVIVGGINGNNSVVENCHVVNCIVAGTKKVGAVVGYTASGIVTNCSAENCNVYTSIDNDNGEYQAGEVIGYINTKDDGAVNNTSGNSFKNVYVKKQGTGNADVITINSAAELYAFANAVNSGDNYFSKIVVLTTDIDLNNAEWTPIGTSQHPFQGTFDGWNHTIGNLKITSGENVGLFGHITLAGDTSKATNAMNYVPGIQSLTLNNVTITADNSGAFVGNANTTTRNAGNGGALCLHDLSLTGDVKIEGANVGGIIGTEWTDFQIAATNITVNANEGSYVKGTGVVGGVFASTPHGSVEHITSNIDVYVTGTYDSTTDKYIGCAGGIVGCAGWTLNDVTCTGNVVATNISETDNGKYQIGKIVGREANNSYWSYYKAAKNSTSSWAEYGSGFVDFTATNTITITLKDGTTLNSNGLTSADKRGTGNKVDYDQSMIGAAIWEWQW